jgi:hypothetical protein
MHEPSLDHLVDEPSTAGGNLKEVVPDVHIAVGVGTCADAALTGNSQVGCRSSTPLEPCLSPQPGSGAFLMKSGRCSSRCSTHLLVGIVPVAEIDGGREWSRQRLPRLCLSASREPRLRGGARTPTHGGPSYPTTPNSGQTCCTARKTLASAIALRTRENALSRVAEVRFGTVGGPHSLQVALRHEPTGDMQILHQTALINSFNARHFPARGPAYSPAILSSALVSGLS